MLIEITLKILLDLQKLMFKCRYILKVKLLTDTFECNTFKIITFLYSKFFFISTFRSNVHSDNLSPRALSCEWLPVHRAVMRTFLIERVCGRVMRCHFSARGTLRCPLTDLYRYRMGCLIKFLGLFGDTVRLVAWKKVNILGDRWANGTQTLPKAAKGQNFLLSLYRSTPVEPLSRCIYSWGSCIFVLSWLPAELIVG